MNCTLCYTHLSEKFDEEYYDCSGCRALVKDINLYPSAEEAKLRYMAHNNDVNDPRYRKFTSPISDYILENFREQHEGLDFGSGTGPVISAVLQEANYKVQQYDLFFANYPGLLERKYDYVFACEVAEHFYDPYLEFETLFNLLKPNGAIILMTLLYNEDDVPEFTTWHYRKDPTHVFIYRRETFEYISERFGFSKCEIGERLVVLGKG